MVIGGLVTPPTVAYIKGVSDVDRRVIGPAAGIAADGDADHRPTCLTHLHDRPAAFIRGGCPVAGRSIVERFFAMRRIFVLR
jgi:hypothetical protein